MEFIGGNHPRLPTCERSIVRCSYHWSQNRHRSSEYRSELDRKSWDEWESRTDFRPSLPSSRLPGIPEITLSATRFTLRTSRDALRPSHISLQRIFPPTSSMTRSLAAGKEKQHLPEQDHIPTREGLPVDSSPPSSNPTSTRPCRRIEHPRTAGSVSSVVCLALCRNPQHDSPPRGFPFSRFAPAFPRCRPFTSSAVATGDGDAAPRRPRGRPRRDVASPALPGIDLQQGEQEDVAPRARGRPRRDASLTAPPSSLSTAAPLEDSDAAPRRPRGRPRRDASLAAPPSSLLGADAPPGENGDSDATPHRPRGRPRHDASLAATPSSLPGAALPEGMDGGATPRRPRGRPPRGASLASASALAGFTVRPKSWNLYRHYKEASPSESETESDSDTDSSSTSTSDKEEAAFASDDDSYPETGGDSEADSDSAFMSDTEGEGASTSDSDSTELLSDDETDPDSETSDSDSADDSPLEYGTDSDSEPSKLDYAEYRHRMRQSAMRLR
ncbi:hypothetical protein B0H13DRAFT_2015286 [Mycena leptocephala]|nr:hypothetical protein B0H13DRAFT_2015286 [Mycena leptocephala]